MRWKQTLKDCAAEVQIEDEEDVKKYCPQGKKKRGKKIECSNKKKGIKWKEKRTK